MRDLLLKLMRVAFEMLNADLLIYTEECNCQECLDSFEHICVLCVKKLMGDDGIMVSLHSDIKLHPSNV